MEFIINLFQPFPADMGINLGRGNLAVTQKHLHRPEVCSMLQEMRGKRMPEDVRMKFLFKPGFLPVGFQDFPYSLPGKSPAASGQKKYRRAFFIKQRTDLVEIIF